MARLVARAMRLGRSASIEAGTFSSGQFQAALGYLMPLLLWPQAAILVADRRLRSHLQTDEIPKLLAWTQGSIPREIEVVEGNRWPRENFDGLLLVSHEDWLADRLGARQHFPAHVPTIVDDLGILTSTARRLLSLDIDDRAWSEGLAVAGDRVAPARELRAELVRSLYQHPPNPYNAYLLDIDERAALREATGLLAGGEGVWSRLKDKLIDPNYFSWAQLDRGAGGLVLHHSPASLATVLAEVWAQQPVVAIDGAVDTHDRQRDYLADELGLEDATCVRFNPDRQTAGIRLYLPDRLPLPNTPQYQPRLLDELHTLIRIATLPDDEGNSASSAPKSSRAETIPMAIAIGDEPLKQTIGALLAAEFGSRIKVEREDLNESDILVCGWDFWCDRQRELPTPQLLAISTLPLPPLEHPLVAGRVARYKQQRQDWFRRYLLPEAMRTLQQAIAPVCAARGIVALFDSRAIYRSYGKQILRAIGPYSELRYLESDLFEPARRDAR